MEFELSDELISQIIFSMEDQNGKYVLDPDNCLLCKKDAIPSEQLSNYYELPVWNSISGFKMMERFVSVLHNPLAREELRSVLLSRKGVFRNFKNTIKSYPEVERVWYSFKDAEMKHLIIRWYNVLRESWGLEKFSEDIEEYDSVLQDDFTFRLCETQEDQSMIQLCEEDFASEIQEKWPGDLGTALSYLWDTSTYETEDNQSFSIAAETVSGEFAGYVKICPVIPGSMKTVLIRSLYVTKKYRGLSLGRQLLSTCLTSLLERGARWVIISSLIMPDQFIPVLLQNGFSQSGTGFILDLLDIN